MIKNEIFFTEFEKITLIYKIILTELKTFFNSGNNKIMNQTNYFMFIEKKIIKYLNFNILYNYFSNIKQK